MKLVTKVFWRNPRCAPSNGPWNIVATDIPDFAYFCQALATRPCHVFLLHTAPSDTLHTFEVTAISGATISETDVGLMFVPDATYIYQGLQL